MLHHSRVSLFTAALATLAASLLLAACMHGPKPRDRRIMVMNFENTVAGDATKDLGQAVAEMMTANLTNYPRVAVIERQDKARLFQKAQQAPERWRKLGKSAKADYLVIGSIAKLNDHYILSSRLMDVADGEIVKGSSINRYCKRAEDIYPVVQAMTRVVAYQVKFMADRADGLQTTPASETGSTVPATVTPTPTPAPKVIAQ